MVCFFPSKTTSRVFIRRVSGAFFFVIFRVDAPQQLPIVTRSLLRPRRLFPVPCCSAGCVTASQAKKQSKLLGQFDHLSLSRRSRGYLHVFRPSRPQIIWITAAQTQTRLSSRHTMAEPPTGKWYNLGGGRASQPPAQPSRFPSMPNVNIPGFRREQVRLYTVAASQSAYIHACLFSVLNRR